MGKPCIFFLPMSILQIYKFTNESKIQLASAMWNYSFRMAEHLASDLSRAGVWIGTDVQCQTMPYN